MPSLKGELARRQGFVLFSPHSTESFSPFWLLRAVPLPFFFFSVCVISCDISLQNCFCFKLYEHWLTVTLLMHCNFVFLNLKNELLVNKSDKITCLSG